ncbi:hypothetical protein NT6N_27040 [Oceaniferula spumae]|uniref:Bacterial sugar transferase domain-containing protein n=1 Tax=Oceaniferula spumae TaxID=2979115 RepID=A0AAT9FNZ7_9BACT
MNAKELNLSPTKSQLMLDRLTAKKDDGSTGSIFTSDCEEFQGVIHWKRAFIRHVYPVILLFTDILLIVALFAIWVSLRYDVDILQAMSRRILLVLTLANVIGIALVGGYSYQTNTGTFRFISEHLIVSFGIFVGVFFIIYSFVAYGYRMNSGRSIIIFTLVAFTCLSIAYRFCLARLKHSLQKGNALCIIGSGSTTADLYQRLTDKKSTHAVFAIDPAGDSIGKHVIDGDSESPVFESLDDLSLNSSLHGRYVENYVIACPMESLPPTFVKRLAVAQFNGNNVCSYEAYLREKMMIIPPSEISMGWALERGFLLTKNVTYGRVKRLADILFGLSGLVLFSPVFLVVAILVKLTSKGPVIFKQPRVGQKEVHFTLYKFRSMKVGSENGSMYTSANDNRITVIGKFLRKTRLDEIPQFWNVLKGDLSLIGPRAEWTELVQGYEQKFPYYHFRHAVKPGITGWAQVNYSYGQNDKDTLEKLYYDLYYVRNHSVILDAIILVKTVYIVIFGRGQ